MKHKTTMYFVADDKDGGAIRLRFNGRISNSVLTVLREAGYHVATKREYHKRHGMVRGR